MVKISASELKYLCAVIIPHDPACEGAKTPVSTIGGHSVSRRYCWDTSIKIGADECLQLDGTGLIVTFRPDFRYIWNGVGADAGKTVYGGLFGTGYEIQTNDGVENYGGNGLVLYYPYAVADDPDKWGAQDFKTLGGDKFPADVPHSIADLTSVGLFDDPPTSFLPTMKRRIVGASIILSCTMKGSSAGGFFQTMCSKTPVDIWGFYETGDDWACDKGKTIAWSTAAFVDPLNNTLPGTATYGITDGACVRWRPSSSADFDMKQYKISSATTSSVDQCLNSTAYPMIYIGQVPTDAAMNLLATCSIVIEYDTDLGWEVTNNLIQSHQGEVAIWENNPDFIRHLAEILPYDYSASAVPDFEDFVKMLANLGITVGSGGDYSIYNSMPGMLLQCNLEALKNPRRIARDAKEKFFKLPKPRAVRRPPMGKHLKMNKGPQKVWPTKLRRLRYPELGLNQEAVSLTNTSGRTFRSSSYPFSRVGGLMQGRRARTQGFTQGSGSYRRPVTTPGNANLYDYAKVAGYAVPALSVKLGDQLGWTDSHGVKGSGKAESRSNPGYFLKNFDRSWNKIEHSDYTDSSIGY